MSRNQRIALLVAVVAVAIVAFVIAQPGDDEDGGGADTAAQTTGRTTAQTEAKTEAQGSGPEATAPEPAPERPEVHRIVFENGAPRGGPQTIEARTGDTVRIVVTSDVPEEVHLHGYDIERAVAPGKPARITFEADLEGQFEFETHGSGTVLGSVVVSPS